MGDKMDSTWTRIEQRMWITTMFVGCAAVYVARTSLPLCMVAISQEMKWSKSDSGSVLSAFYWGYAMTQILGGYLADKIGGDRVIVLTGAAWSMLTFWTPVILDTYPHKESLLGLAILSRITLGCVQGMHYPSISSIFSRRIPDSDRAFSFSTAISGTHFGTLISGSLGSYLLYRFGWRCVFYTAGSIGMAWVLFLRYGLMARQRRKDNLLSSLSDTKPKQNGANQAEPVPWLILLKSPALWAVLTAHFGHLWGFNVLVNWLPTYFHETYPEGKGWVFNVVPWVLSIPTGFAAGWLSDSMTQRGMQVTLVRKLFTTIALLGVGIFIYLVTYTDSYYTALFLIAMALTCNAFHTSAVCVIPQDIAPKYSGSVYGIMNTAGSVTGFVGVYMAGHVLETTKNWNLVFAQTMRVLFGGWLIFTVFGSSKRIV